MSPAKPSSKRFRCQSYVNLPEGRSISPTIFPSASRPRGGRVRPSARSPAPRSPRSGAARCPGPRPSAAPTPRPGCCKPWASTWEKCGKKMGWNLEKQLKNVDVWKNLETCWDMKLWGWFDIEAFWHVNVWGAERRLHQLHHQKSRFRVPRICRPPNLKRNWKYFVQQIPPIAYEENRSQPSSWWCLKSPNGTWPTPSHGGEVIYFRGIRGDDKSTKCIQKMRHWHITNMPRKIGRPDWHWGTTVALLHGNWIPLKSCPKISGTGSLQSQFSQ